MEGYFSCSHEVCVVQIGNFADRFGVLGVGVVAHVSPHIGQQGDEKGVSRRKIKIRGSHD